MPVANLAAPVLGKSCSTPCNELVCVADTIASSIIALTWLSNAAPIGFATATDILGGKQSDRHKCT